jgi:transitional endoplasmic reticulum ATPase
VLLDSPDVRARWDSDGGSLEPAPARSEDRHQQMIRVLQYAERRGRREAVDEVGAPVHNVVHDAGPRGLGQSQGVVGSDGVSAPQITLTARLTTSAQDARRGLVRLHPEVLDALGLRPWDAVRLIGTRSSAALAAAGQTAPGIALLDDLTLSNVGLSDGSQVVLTPVQVPAARSITVAGSALVSHTLSAETLRLALAGKVLTAGDAVSLLPQDVAPGSDAATVRSRLATMIGMSWTTELLTVTATDPTGPVAPHPSTVLSWRDGQRTGEAPVPPPVFSRPAQELPVPAVAELVGAQDAARRLAEWLELTFRRPDLLRKLGASTRLGVAVHGPEGVGKATMVRAVAREAGAYVVELAAPSVAALQPGPAAQQVHDAVAAARAAQPSVLLITDVEALLPATDPPPLATVVLDTLAPVLEQVVLVVTTAHPASVDPRLRAPDLVDRELSLPLPDARTRTELLRVLLSAVPLATDVDLAAVGERTPGFVAADLVALRREAAVRAALRYTAETGEPDLTIIQQDLIGALDTVRPISMSASDAINTGGLTLDDVGDMTAIKQALTEAVLWPLRYPDSFTRLGIDPPRGVLLYGPPGCGKTFLVRALAGAGALNVFSVKGAELLDKWVGESERAVRELFRRARDAAPALVFLDEVDALAPRRGGSSDAGVADRVVAALLTELDGVEPMRDVIVLGSTNRPELIDPALLRPGRLERLVYVPPPDAPARAAILQAAVRNTPLATDVNLNALAGELEGYSAADCAALIREAALTAMRASLDATEVTAAQLAIARQAVRPSLDPVQLTQLASYAATRSPSTP